MLANILQVDGDFFLQVTEDFKGLYGVIKSGDSGEDQMREIGNPRYFVKDAVLYFAENNSTPRRIGEANVLEVTLSPNSLLETMGRMQSGETVPHWVHWRNWKRFDVVCDEFGTFWVIQDSSELGVCIEFPLEPNLEKTGYSHRSNHLYLVCGSWEPV